MVACEQSAHIELCVAVDVTTVERHLTSTNKDTTALQNGDEMVKASPSIGALKWVGGVWVASGTHILRKQDSKHIRQLAGTSSGRWEDGQGNIREQALTAPVAWLFTI